MMALYPTSPLWGGRNCERSKQFRVGGSGGIAPHPTPFASLYASTSPQGGGS